MTRRARVVVADDHEMFRAGVVELLQTLANVEVVGEARTGAEAIELATTTRPDVVLLDLDMPDTVASGEATTTTAAAIRRVSPTTNVIVLTMHDDADVVRQLLRSGVSGYLVKSAGREELCAAITAAARNQNSVTLTVSRSTATALASGALEGPALLTRRELDVLHVLAEGGSNRTIARELHLAESTVKRHLATISAKLDASTRLQVVRRAQQLGILPAP